MFSRLQMSENILERPDKCYSPNIIEKLLETVAIFRPFPAEIGESFPISFRQVAIGSGVLGNLEQTSSLAIIRVRPVLSVSWSSCLNVTKDNFMITDYITSVKQV